MKTYRHTILRVSCGLLFLLYSALLQAQTYKFDFNDQCDAAYDKIMSFRTEEGMSIIKEQLSSDPYNLVPVYLENYEDLIVLMFNGDAQEYQKRRKNLDSRLTKLNKGSSKDPWLNFTRANLYLQWALIKIRFGDYMAAANDFRRSYQLIRLNKDIFPDFKYNNIVYGLEEAIVGSVPDKHKWLTAVLGMKGDVKKGTAKIVDFLNTRDGTTRHLRAEAIFYYVYLKFTLLSEKEAVWDYLQKSELDYRGNHLFAFLKSNIALSMNKAAEAEHLLKGITRNSSYLEVPLLDYYLGVAYFYNNNEACKARFDSFLKNYSGQAFVKDAYHKLSIYSYVNNDESLYRSYKENILKKGNTLIESDKQAERFAGSDNPLHRELLLARMYSDGGYIQKSLQVLQKIQESSLSDIGHKAEYHYRFAKVYVIQKKNDNAIVHYKKTIELGDGRQEHYAARSCIELGELYEARGQKSTALDYYKKCLAMKNHDYKSSLDQKAKAAINRLNN